MDIVRIFENYATAREYCFIYGTKAVQNLLTNPHNFEQDKIHILLDPVRRVSEITAQGLSVRSRRYIGRYMILLRDDFDKPYFNEKGADSQQSKYTCNIEPLLPVYAAIEKQFFACDGYDVLQHENIDVTDALDANMTGLVCTFQIRVYE